MIPMIFVDADSLYFRICFKTKKKKEIRKYIKDHLNEIEENNFLGNSFIAVKGYDNWRKDYYPEYKANRPELDPDMKKALTYAHQYLVGDCGAVQADGMEADDLVSIWANEARAEDKTYVIAGIDKDLLQIPGNHYNYVKKIHQFIDDDTANYNLMFQCLVGDSGDNIPGIRGVGPVKAKKILSSVPDRRRWSRVKAAWRANHSGDPSVSLRLLKMLTSWEEYEDVKSEISRRKLLQ